MGRNDKNPPRSHRQLHKKPLELDNEEKNPRILQDPKWYIYPYI